MQYLVFMGLARVFWFRLKDHGWLGLTRMAQTPAGALVDHIRSKRALITAGIGASLSQVIAGLIKNANMLQAAPFTLVLQQFNYIT